jgi:hypothetical protein
VCQQPPRLERLRCRHRGAEHRAGRRSCSLHFPSAGRQAAQDGAEPAGTPALPTQVRTVRRWGGPEAAREHHQPGNGHQTPGLATAARKRDHVGTKPRVTGRNQCPTRFVEMAAEQDKRIRQGITRTGGDAQYKTTDLAVGGSNPSRRANARSGPSSKRSSRVESGSVSPCLLLTLSGLDMLCDPGAITGHGADRSGAARRHRCGRR